MPAEFIKVTFKNDAHDIYMKVKAEQNISSLIVGLLRQHYSGTLPQPADAGEPMPNPEAEGEIVEEIYKRYFSFLSDPEQYESDTDFIAVKGGEANAATSLRQITDVLFRTYPKYYARVMTIFNDRHPTFKRLNL